MADGASADPKGDFRSLPLTAWSAVWIRFGTKITAVASSAPARPEQVPRVRKKLHLPVRRLACREALEKVSEEQKVYLYYLQSAIWKSARVLMQQISPESHNIARMLHIACSNSAYEKVKPEGPITANELDKFYNYLVRFWGNMGNYDTATGEKFVPDLPADDFEKILWRHSSFLNGNDRHAVMRIFSDVKDEVFNRFDGPGAGFAPDVSKLSSTGLVDKAMTPEDIAIASIWLATKGIDEKATRLTKARKGQIQVWMPLVGHKTDAPVRPYVEKSEEFQGQKFEIMRGDYLGLIHNMLEDARLALALKDSQSGKKLKQKDVEARVKARKKAGTWLELMALTHNIDNSQDQDTDAPMTRSDSSQACPVSIAKSSETAQRGDETVGDKPSEASQVEDTDGTVEAGNVQAYKFLSEVFPSFDHRVFDWYGARAPLLATLGLQFLENADEGVKLKRLVQSWKPLMSKLPWPENKMPEELVRRPLLVACTCLALLPPGAAPYGWLSLGDEEEGSCTSKAAQGRVVAIFTNVVAAMSSHPSSVRKGATEEETKSNILIAKEDVGLLEKVGLSASMMIAYLEAFAAASVAWAVPPKPNLEPELRPKIEVQRRKSSGAKKVESTKSMKSNKSNKKNKENGNKETEEGNADKPEPEAKEQAHDVISDKVAQTKTNETEQIAVDPQKSEPVEAQKSEPVEAQKSDKKSEAETAIVETKKSEAGAAIVENKKSEAGKTEGVVDAGEAGDVVEAGVETQKSEVSTKPAEPEMELVIPIPVHKMEMQPMSVCKAFEYLRSAVTALVLLIEALGEEDSDDNPFVSMGITEESERAKIVQCAMLQAARNGLVSLGRAYCGGLPYEKADEGPGTNRWSSFAIHEQVRYALFATMYNADNGLFKIGAKDSEVTVQVDSEKIQTVALPTLRKLLGDLHLYRVSEDLVGFSSFFHNVTHVTQEGIKSELTNISKSVPPSIVYTQMHLEKNSAGKMMIYEFEPSIEGVICSMQYHLGDYIAGRLEQRQGEPQPRPRSNSRGPRYHDPDARGTSMGPRGARSRSASANRGGYYPTGSRATSRDPYVSGFDGRKGETGKGFGGHRPSITSEKGGKHKGLDMNLGSSRVVNDKKGGFKKGGGGKKGGGKLGFPFPGPQPGAKGIDPSYNKGFGKRRPGSVVPQDRNKGGQGYWAFIKGKGSKGKGGGGKYGFSWDKGCGDKGGGGKGGGKVMHHASEDGRLYLYPHASPQDFRPPSRAPSRGPGFRKGGDDYKGRGKGYDPYDGGRPSGCYGKGCDYGKGKGGCGYAQEYRHPGKGCYGGKPASRAPSTGPCRSGYPDRHYGKGSRAPSRAPSVGRGSRAPSVSRMEDLGYDVRSQRVWGGKDSRPPSVGPGPRRAPSIGYRSRVPSATGARSRQPSIDHGLVRRRGLTPVRRGSISQGGSTIYAEGYGPGGKRPHLPFGADFNPGPAPSAYGQMDAPPMQPPPPPVASMGMQAWGSGLNPMDPVGAMSASMSSLGGPLGGMGGPMTNFGGCQNTRWASMQSSVMPSAYQSEASEGGGFQNFPAGAQRAPSARRNMRYTSEDEFAARRERRRSRSRDPEGNMGHVPSNRSVNRLGIRARSQSVTPADPQAMNLPRMQVKDLNPDLTNFNLLVRCCKVSAKAANSADSKAIVAEAEVGDESGVVKMRCTAQQAKTLSVGFAVFVEGAKVVMVQGFIRLEVGPRGSVKTVPGLQYFMPNRKNNVSLAEWELVNNQQSQLAQQPQQN